MGDTQRKFACFQHGDQLTGFFLTLQSKSDLFLYILGSAQRIPLQNLTQLLVAVGGIVEQGNCLVEGLGREVTQLLLECAKSDGCLVEIIGGFCCFQTDTVLNEFINAPGFAIGCVVVVFPFGGGNQSQGTVLFGDLFVQVRGDSCDVILQSVNILESGADHLQGIAVTCFGDHQISLVYMTGAEWLADHRGTIQPEIGQNIRKKSIHRCCIPLIFYSYRTIILHHVNFWK